MNIHRRNRPLSHRLGNGGLWGAFFMFGMLYIVRYTGTPQSLINEGTIPTGRVSGI